MQVVLTALTLFLLLAGCSATSERETAGKEFHDSDCTGNASSFMRARAINCNEIIGI